MYRIIIMLAIIHIGIIRDTSRNICDRGNMKRMVLVNNHHHHHHIHKRIICKHHRHHRFRVYNRCNRAVAAPRGQILKSKFNYSHCTLYDRIHRHWSKWKVGIRCQNEMFVSHDMIKSKRCTDVCVYSCFFFLLFFLCSVENNNRIEFTERVFFSCAQTIPVQHTLNKQKKKFVKKTRCNELWLNIRCV